MKVRIPRTIGFDVKDYETLKELSKKTGEKITDMVYEALRDFLKKRGEE